MTTTAKQLDTQVDEYEPVEVRLRTSAENGQKYELAFDMPLDVLWAFVERRLVV
jgi:hypothetical protein